ncbi:MAG: ATP-binding cassette domain-containing protein [Bacteroidetes bacterium]|nr:MAG: ATP-binding cassette domain-containing protein [Bacteroidota bacterium]
MIEVKELKKSFGELNVLKGINTTFEVGKTNLIIGQSGSGKTVFMKCLVGLLEPDSGGVFFDKNNFTLMNEKQRTKVRKKMGMLFQGSALFDSLTVEENVVFPLEMFNKDMTRKEKLERAHFCLDRVNILDANHLYPAEISGGMKKRVAIARAIANKPDYLFCDEPNSGLDPQTAIVIDRLISEITKEFRITTIINTHDMNSVMEIGDHVIFIYKGNLWWEGSSDEILTTGNKEVEDFVYASELVRKLK